VIAKVVWSAGLCLVQSACLIALFCAALVGILLLPGLSRSETIYKLVFGAVACTMSFGPVLTFWAWRRWPMYPLDALGLFVVPLAAPFVVARAARIAFVALFGIHLTRSADAILIVVGVGAWLVGTITFARIFSRYAQLPGPPRALFQR